MVEYVTSMLVEYVTVSSTLVEYISVQYVGWIRHCVQYVGWIHHCVQYVGWIRHCVQYVGWIRYCVQYVGWIRYCVQYVGWIRYCVQYVVWTNSYKIFLNFMVFWHTRLGVVPRETQLCLFFLINPGFHMFCKRRSKILVSGWYRSSYMLLLSLLRWYFLFHATYMTFSVLMLASFLKTENLTTYRECT